VRDVVVHFTTNEIDAETAAGALRANHLHPRVARDDADPLIARGSAIGRFVVLVPEGEDDDAREILREPKRRRA
jgi:hypothetical protein